MAIFEAGTQMLVPGAKADIRRPKPLVGKTQSLPSEFPTTKTETVADGDGSPTLAYGKFSTTKEVSNDEGAIQNNFRLPQNRNTSLHDLIHYEVNQIGLRSRR